MYLFVAFTHTENTITNYAGNTYWKTMSLIKMHGIIDRNVLV